MRETYSYGVLRVHEPARLAGHGGGLGGVVGWGERTRLAGPVAREGFENGN
jgi:hypothetical protein